MACKLANYLRYFLRIASAYVIVAFTIERLYVIYKPFLKEKRTKKTAWQTIGFILISFLIFTAWSPFMFRLEKNHLNDTYCDMNKKLKYEYSYFNSVYVFFVIIVPSIVLFVCNIFIIKKIIKNNHLRKGLIANYSPVKNPKTKLATANKPIDYKRSLANSGRLRLRR